MPTTKSSRVNQRNREVVTAETHGPCRRVLSWYAAHGHYPRVLIWD